MFQINKKRQKERKKNINGALFPEFWFFFLNSEFYFRSKVSAALKLVFFEGQEHK